ncbi:MAG TPA: tetratricopeptide repeat protein, partial [Chloroflexota bacterium]
KGKIGTVPVYPALGLRERFGERWETSEEATPLIGRDREMVALLDAWVRAQGGEGQLVTVIGDAGVGKSRLIAELIDKVASGSSVRVVRARCLSYGQGISLWLLSDLLRSLFGLREQDSVEEVGPRLRSSIGGLLAVAGEDTRAEALDVLGEVLGLAPGNSVVANAGPQIRRQSLIRSLRSVLGAFSERAPMVIVLEDVHWIDEASQDVLKELLSDVPGLRLLVLGAQRPGWNAPWSEWGWTERLTLRPLSDQEAVTLAGAVLGGMRLNPELERYVADRAGGNPFFVEEMLRALQEAGDLEERNGEMRLARGAAERLPSTLTEVLLARLDRLEGEVRTLTQIASVIGRSFSVRLLAAITGQAEQSLDRPLAALQQAEIAFPRRGPDLEYVFKHVSMREAAYNTLVQKRRQALHLATARATAEVYPSDEYIEIIAYHYAKTEEHEEAAQWLERAGDRAVDVYANEAAIAGYQETLRRLELVGAGETAVARIDEKLGGVLHTVARFDEALQVLEQAVEIYRQSRDLEAVGRVTARIGRVHRDRGSVDEGVARLTPLLDLLAWSGPSAGLASLYVALAHLYFAGGRYEECLDAAERGVDTARSIGDEGLLAAAEMRRGTVLYMLGKVEEGTAGLESSVHLAEATGNLEILSIAVSNLGELYFEIGALEQGRTNIERSLQLAERVGELASMGYSLVMIGWILYFLGEWEEAEGSIVRGADVIRSVDSSWYSAYPPLQLGRLRVAQGAWEDAARNLEECVTIAGPIGDIQALQGAHRLLGEIEVLEGRAQAAIDRLKSLEDTDPLSDQIGLLATLAWARLEEGLVDQADATVSRALDMARVRHHKPLLPEALRVQAMIRSRQERWDEAESIFGQAVAVAQSLPYPYGEARARYDWGLVRLRHERPEEAADQLEQALAIFRRLGARRDAERAHQDLESLEHAGPLKVHR